MGNTLRDEHVQGAEFLDVEHHPQMLFRSASIAETGSCYSMTSDLTLRGVTLHVSYHGSTTFPVDGSTHDGFTARGSTSRSALGVSSGVPVIRGEVLLTLDVQFVAPAVEG